MDFFKRILITGDIHGDVFNLYKRLSFIGVSKDDLVILLGDCGLEFTSFYFPTLAYEDVQRQQFLKEHIPATIVCVQGNHDVPFNEMHGTKINKFETTVVESNGINFALNGSVLNVNNKKFLVLGGAYSVDKEYRLRNNYPYWKNEEMSSDEMRIILSRISGQKFDYVLSHTCPYSQMPQEALLQGKADSKLENRTEKFLDYVKSNIEFDHWYCGHFHINKTVDKLSFLMEGFEILDYENIKQENVENNKNYL